MDIGGRGAVDIRGRERFGCRRVVAVNVWALGCFGCRVKIASIAIF